MSAGQPGLSYEVELKFRLDVESDFSKTLEFLSATRGPIVDQCDTYLAHPSRDFAATDEAFRIRSVGEDNCLTYKGPLLDRQTKSRQEVEVPFESGGQNREVMLTLLGALGFRPVRDVRKRRTPFRLEWEGRAVDFSVDVVEDLGTFVELETIATEENWERARESLLSLAARLDLRNSERRSYLQLLLESDAAGSP